MIDRLASHALQVVVTDDSCRRTNALRQQPTHQSPQLSASGCRQSVAAVKTRYTDVMSSVRVVSAPYPTTSRRHTLDYVIVWRLATRYHGYAHTTRLAAANVDFTTAFCALREAGIPRHRHGLPRRQPLEDVRVAVSIGVGVMEFQLDTQTAISAIAIYPCCTAIREITL